MKNLILFKGTKKSIVNKLTNHIYVDILNSHDTELISKNFTLLELILLERAWRKADSVLKEEFKKD